jgi:hypothetical protein
MSKDSRVQGDFAIATEGVGAEFAQALAVKDFQRLHALLADDIDFRGMTPGMFWEANNADEVIGEILSEWFEDQDEIERLVECSTRTIGDRQHVSYLFDVHNPDGRFLVEQQMYFDVVDGRIALARVLCSGYRSIEEQSQP